MLRLRQLRRRLLDRAARRQCPYFRRRWTYGGYLDPPHHVAFAERVCVIEGGAASPWYALTAVWVPVYALSRPSAAPALIMAGHRGQRMSSVRVFYRTWNAALRALGSPPRRASWARAPGKAAWRRLMRRRGADAWARRWVLRRAVCELGTRRLGRGEARRGARRGRAPGERSPGVD